MHISITVEVDNLDDMILVHDALSTLPDRITVGSSGSTISLPTIPSYSSDPDIDELEVNYAVIKAMPHSATRNKYGIELHTRLDVFSSIPNLSPDEKTRAQVVIDDLLETVFKVKKS